MAIRKEIEKEILEKILKLKEYFTSSDEHSEVLLRRQDVLAIFEDRKENK